MTKSKRLVAFLVFPLIFLSLVILVLFIGKIENSQTDRSGFTVNPTGHLTVDLEFGTINIETTDQDHINITTTKKWKAKLSAWQPKFVEWISKLPGDFEITTKNGDSDTQSDIQIEGKFKRGQEHWQDGLKWLTIDLRVTVPRQYKVTLKTASSGDIRAEVTTQPQRPWILNTSENGEIDVTLHPDIEVDVDAQTQGNISSDFSIQSHSNVENMLKGQVNGGGPLLKLRADAGEIHLRRK